MDITFERLTTFARTRAFNVYVPIFYLLFFFFESRRGNAFLRQGTRRFLHRGVLGPKYTSTRTCRWYGVTPDSRVSSPTTCAPFASGRSTSHTTTYSEPFPLVSSMVRFRVARASASHITACQVPFRNSVITCGHSGSETVTRSKVIWWLSRLPPENVDFTPSTRLETVSRVVSRISSRLRPPSTPSTSPQTR